MLLTMDVTLALIGLHHKEVRRVACDMILITCCIAAQNLLQSVIIECQSTIMSIQERERGGSRIYIHTSES